MWNSINTLCIEQYLPILLSQQSHNGSNYPKIASICGIRDEYHKR